LTKRNTPSQLGGQASFFFIGNVFTLIVGLPLQIYVARTLGASNLGVYSLLEGGVALVAGFIGLGLAPTLVKFIPQYLANQEFTCIRDLVWKGLLVLSMLSFIVIITGWIALPWIEQQWPQLQEHHWSVVLMGLTLPLGILVFYFSQGLRGFQEIRFMVVGTSFLQLTVKAVLAIIFLSLGLGLLGYISAVVVSIVVALLWLAIGLYRKITTLPKNENSIERCNSKPWIRYASIMYGGSLLGSMTAPLDRFLIGLFASVSAVGVLAVVKQLQQLPVIFLQMFLAVAAPMFSSAHARNDVQERQHIYNLTTDWVLRASLPMFMFFLLFTVPLLSLYGEEFVELGKWPLWILVGAQLINLLCGPVGNLLNMSGLETLMLKISVIQSILTAIGLLVFVYQFGLIGGAWVLAAAIVIHNLVVLHYAKKYLAITWWDSRYMKWILPSVTTLLTGLGLLVIEPHPGSLSLLVSLIILYTVFHGVSLVQGLHNDDRELLRHLRDKLTGSAA